MIALILFSCVAAALVWWAGRKDAALDPRLTTALLGLLALFPVLVETMPKIAVLPRSEEIGGFPWAWVVGGIWLLGFLFELGRLLMLSRIIRGWERDSVLLEKIGDIELRMSDRVPGALAAGVIKKLIFVPSEWNEWDEERKKLVLQHEMAHHRRRDPLRRWIAGLAVAVNWFNPLVRWMVRRLMLQCEFACDAEVLRSGVNRSVYATLLCDLAENVPSNDMAPAISGRRGLEHRVRRMMKHETDHDDPATGWIILFSVAMAGLLALLGAEKVAGYTQQEIDLRRTANPFPGSMP